MIRRIQRLASSGSKIQGNILSRSNYWLLALLMFFSLNLFVSKSDVRAEDSISMVTASPAEMADIIEMAEEVKFLRVPLWDNDLPVRGHWFGSHQLAIQPLDFLCRIDIHQRRRLRSLFFHGTIPRSVCRQGQAH